MKTSRFITAISTGLMSLLLVACSPNIQAMGAANQGYSSTTTVHGVALNKVYVGQSALDSAQSAINGAKSSIDLDMYEFTNKDILNALVSAHKRGVKERVILDESSSSTASVLQQSGVDVHVVHVAGGIDHVKFLAIDGKTVLLGSVNFGQGSGQNEDASVWLTEGNDAKTFFNDTWNGSVPKVNGPMLYDGVAVQTEAIHLIDGAKKHIVIGMFAWTDTATQRAVIHAKQRGVHVTVYIDGHQSENRKTISLLQNAGVQVVVAHTQQWLHLKTMVVDDNTVLMGSANWSYHGFHVNNELDFETSSGSVASGIESLLQQTNE